MKRWHVVAFCILGAAVLWVLYELYPFLRYGFPEPMSEAERQVGLDATIVAPYISPPPNENITLVARFYLGGTAVIGPNGSAFWVHDGNAYTVNQSSREDALELEQAPGDVKYDDEFIKAVLGTGRFSQLDLQEAMKELNEASSQLDRFDALIGAARASFLAGNVENAREFAAELLALLPNYEGNWSYGDAVHSANLVFGQIALREGRIDDAKMYLLKSGRSPGSSQLDSFGPNMILAKELLETGQSETVLEYFDLCREFWEMHNGRLDLWSQQVEDGEIPDFGANLHY